jgi:hypothetical protein
VGFRRTPNKFLLSASQLRRSPTKLRSGAALKRAH